MDFKQAKRNRRVDRWIVILLLTTLALGLNYLASSLHHRVDLSPEKKFSLSRESLALLNKMEDSVDLIITIRNDNHLPKVIQKLLLDLDLLLQTFEQQATKHQIRVHKVNLDSPKIKLELIEKYKVVEPNTISLYSSNGFKKTIFRFDDKDSTNPYDLSKSFQSRDSRARQAIWQSGFYEDWKESGQGVLEPKFFRGEQVIIESILDVVGPKDTKNVVYFTRGHGEASPTDFSSDNGLSEFRRFIEESNLDVTTIDLSLVEAVPTDAKLIIIAHPKGIFLDKEVANIRNFVNSGGGSVIVCIDPVNDVSMTDRPVFGLRNILKEWGLRCHDMLVYDSNIENYDYFSGSYYLSTYPSSNHHQIIKPLMEKEYRIFADRCRPVEIASEKNPNFRSQELIFSSRNSLALSGWVNRKIPPQKNELLDIEGPVPVVSVSQSLTSSKKSKIVVVGCSSVFANKNLKRNSGNKSLCRNIIRWINDDKDFLNLPPTEVNQYTIAMNKSDLKKLSYILCTIPILVAITGIFVNWLRKEL